MVVNLRTITNGTKMIVVIIQTWKVYLYPACCHLETQISNKPRIVPYMFDYVSFRDFKSPKVTKFKTKALFTTTTPSPLHFIYLDMKSKEENNVLTFHGWTGSCFS